MAAEFEPDRTSAAPNVPALPPAGVAAGGPAPPPPLPPPPLPPAAGQLAASVGVEHRFEFRGQVREYFGIWIVNVALTVLTLGIFSAWAKVRSERWFYGNTWVAGAPFEYLAQPMPILRGRIIAAAFLAAYVLLGQWAPLAQPVLLLVLGIATPWLVLAGLRFRARYSAWRTLNFRFTGDLGEAIKAWLLVFLLLVPTAGLAYPWAKYLQRRYYIEEHRFGGARFAFAARPGAFYAIYLVGWVVALVGAVAAAMAGGALFNALEAPGQRPDPDVLQVLGFAMVGLAYAGMFLGWVWIAVGVTNLTFNRSTLGPHAFRSSLRWRDLFVLYLGNTVAILGSLGLLVPWAQVRMARYRASHLVLLARGSLDEQRSEDRAGRGAAGAETADAFDVDLSL